MVQSVSGVSLSAAARSADALVYDKLTPNCQSIIFILSFVFYFDFLQLLIFL